MMKFIRSLAAFAALFLIPYSAEGQCLTIESILVDACGIPEIDNEMLRFNVGPSDLNVSNMNMTFGFGQPFPGIRTPDFLTQSKVNQLNATIQSCGYLIEPVGGLLPANSTVLVIGSVNVSVTANPFTTLSDTIILLFKNTSNSPNAYYINYAPSNTTIAPDAQTTTVSFGLGCSSSATYIRPQLITQFGNIGAQDGATVNFSANGTPTYINNGCIAPFEPVSAAWINPAAICNTVTALELNSYITGTSDGVFSGEGVSNGIFNPNGLNGNYNITYSVFSGSCENAITHTISVIDQPDAAFTLPLFACGESMLLNPLITGTAGGIFSGPGVNNNIFNSTGLNGLISISYSVGSGICRDTSIEAIQVDEQFNASWSAPSEICEGQSIDFNVFITGTEGGVWSGNMINPEGILNTTSLVDSILITYSVGSENCSTEQSYYISIITTPSSNWSAPATICSGEQLFLDSLVTGTPNGIWIGNGVSQNIFDATGLDGTIEITYSIGYANCESNTTQAINVIQLPAPLFEGDTVWCEGYPASDIQIINAESATVFWYSDESLNEIIYEGNNFTPPAISNIYFVTLIENGCSSPESSIEIIISPISTSIITNTENAEIPFNLIATSESNNVDSCIWFFEDELFDYNDGDIYPIETEGTYTLKRICFNADGCEAEAEITFEVIDPAIKFVIPNVFSPNGDGINDVFNFEMKGILQLSGQIFNRWGKMIYSWNDLFSFWNGNENNQKSPEGTYFYILLVTDQNSVQTEYKGTVNLVR